MSHIYIPTTSPEDWRRLLAEPDKHWKRGYSARALACCWETEGFPFLFSPATCKREFMLK